MRGLLGLGAAFLAATLLATGCGDGRSPNPGDGGASRARTSASGGPQARPALLLAQAQFKEQTDPNGERRITPGAARLTIAHQGDHGWTVEVLEDPESNVFHRALPFAVPDERPGILTIGANPAPAPALMKVWSRGPGGWQGTTLSSAAFGVRFNRFRDVEIGDVTGDGVPELVVATHDRGVVAVLHRTVGQQWAVTMIDEALNTFVHEIELGDVNGDGVAEIFATPSAPNRVDRGLQPGRIVMYVFDGSEWVSSSVAVLENRHAKEILVTDIEGVGQPDVIAAIESPGAGSAPGNDRGGDVTIRRYRLTGGAWDSVDLATIPSESCRFLCAGDVDGDGQVELIASCRRSGVWLLRPGPVPWAVEQIDASSTAVELATTLADLDHDGVDEIYVAADDQGFVRRLEWNGGSFQLTDLVEIRRGDMSFGLEACLDPRYLR